MIPARSVVNIDASLFLSLPTYDNRNDPEGRMLAHRWLRLLCGDPADTELASSKFQFIDSWLESYANAEGEFWETYSACERVVNLCDFITFLPASQKSSQVLAGYYDFIAYSLHKIMWNLELRGRLTNNHILNNARALVIGGIATGNGKAVKLGLYLLRRYLPILVVDGGCLRERSSHYQLLVTLWLWDICYYVSGSKEHVAQIQFLDDYKNQMLEVCRALCDCPSLLVDCNIGDSSPDISVANLIRRFQLCHGLSLVVDSPVKKGVRRAGDWYYLQCKDSQIVLNCPSGSYPMRYPTHGHNDISSFVWSYKGKTVLFDSGRKDYTASGLSIAQKSALGHSCVLVDGLAPLAESITRRATRVPAPWGRAAISVAIGDGCLLSIGHDGFRRATSVSHYKRLLRLTENEIAVTDEFQGNGKASITVLWHIGPDVESFDHESLQIQRGDGNGLRFLFEDSSQPDHCDLLNGSEFSIRLSNDYGEELDSFLLVCSYERSLPFKMLTRVSLLECVA